MADVPLGSRRLNHDPDGSTVPITVALMFTCTGDLRHAQLNVQGHRRTYG
jgi:hypothetical protein